MRLHYYTREWRDERSEEMIIRHVLANEDELYIHTRPVRGKPTVPVCQKAHVDAAVQAGRETER
jgi:hypothetical protein